MAQQICKECGATFEQSATVCPSCGCPVVQKQSQPPKKRRNWIHRINYLAFLSLILGFVILSSGNNLIEKTLSLDVYSARSYDAEYAAFGGDFYTEIYKASDIIVDELDDINSGIEDISESMSKLAEGLYYPFGVLIKAVGLAVIALSCCHILKKD